MEILIETKRIGNALRVSAMDAESGIEIAFQAPANASRAQLQQLAASKLTYVMQSLHKK